MLGVGCFRVILNHSVLPGVELCSLIFLHHLTILVEDHKNQNELKNEDNLEK